MMTKNDPAKAQQFFLDKITYTCGPVDVDHLVKEKADIAIIDVRAAEDYQQGHVPGAVNVPKDKWNSLEGLQKGKTNIVYCYSQTCHLSARACVEFAGKGFSVVEMEGGMKSWKEHNFNTEPAQKSGTTKQQKSGTGKSRVKSVHFEETAPWDQPESGTRR